MGKIAPILLAALLSACAVPEKIWKSHPKEEQPDTSRELNAQEKLGQIMVDARHVYVQCLDLAMRSLEDVVASATDAAVAAQGRCSSEYGDYELKLSGFYMATGRWEQREYQRRKGVEEAERDKLALRDKLVAAAVERKLRRQ